MIKRSTEMKDKIQVEVEKEEHRRLKRNGESQ